MDLDRNLREFSRRFSLTTSSSSQFDDAWGRRLIVSIDDLEVPFISRGDLVANRRATKRPQDIADVARLTQTDWARRSTCRSRQFGGAIRLLLRHAASCDSVTLLGEGDDSVP
jgi:hypothetical protein